MTTHRRIVTGAGPRIRVAWITDSHLWGDADGNPDFDVSDRPPRWRFWAGSYRLQKFVDDVIADPPDLVLCTGDLVDSRGDLTDYTSLFLPEWNRIPAGITKVITIGNHDLGSGRTADDVADALGLPETLQGGSRFNQSLSIKGVARVIALDTNITASGHAALSNGELQPAAIAWLQAELLAATESIVVIAMHHPPQTNQFVEAHRDAFVSTVQSAQAVRAFRCVLLTGHWHHYPSPWPSYALGGNIDALGGTCLVDDDVGQFNRLEVGRSRFSYWGVATGLPPTP